MKIAFISDIHEDIISLEKAFKIISKENCNYVICLGDIVGFTLPFYRYINSRNADQCIKLVKEHCDLSVIGNHDLYAIKRIPEFNAGFDYGNNWYDLDYDQKFKKGKNKIWLYENNELTSFLSDNSIEFLQRLKEVDFFNCENEIIMISHFCFPDFSGSTIFFPSETFHLSKHFEFMNNYKSQLSLSGHGHVEGIIKVDQNKFTTLKFGNHKYSEDLTWIVIPCIAKTTRENGFVILDTFNKEIKIISLNNYYD
ncbi:MAG: metallophosphoesterase [Melioribacteraceae bacterium]|nr:metallophosphoesterase [Melioribacteraceae bacterium]